MQNLKPILLVEDDDTDALIARQAFKDIEVANEVVHKVDGEYALEYLRDESNKKPGIILLDLNMPRMNGFELLKIIKADAELKKIPVVILTTSNMKQDISESFKLGVAGYIVKPLNYKQLLEAIKTINQYWDLSKLPNKPL